MEKSTILKLRQAESPNVSTNGSFKITLKEGIQMKEGDSMRIHTAILDTTTESVITLDKDTDITMTTIKYITNIENGQAGDGLGASGDTLWCEYGANPKSTLMPDLKRYYSMHGKAMGDDVYHVSGLNTRPKAVTKAKFGGIDLRCTYLDPLTGKAVSPAQVIHFPPQKTVNHLRKPFTFPISRYVENKVFNIENTADEFHAVNMDVIGVGDVVFGNGGDPVTSTDLLVKPHEETLSFTLAEGTYTPAEIGQIITDKMSVFNSLGPTGSNYTTSFPVNNPFLSTLAREQYLVSQLPGSQQYLLMPEIREDLPGGKTVPNIMQPGTGFNPPTSIINDRLIGANQTSLNFDTNLKKLNFDLLQTPWYINPGSGQFVPGIQYPAGNAHSDPAPSPAVPIVKEPTHVYSGIAFTNLTPPDFWQSLGFNGSILAKVTNPDPPQQITLDDTSVVFATYIEANVGEQITGTFLGNDIVVNKGAAYTTPNQTDTITSLTAPIISNRTFDTVDNDEGYYLIDVGVKFPQKMIGGQDNTSKHPATGSNRVQGIMGKYFTSGNFLQDTGAAAVQYTHVGEPQMINELDVRILHADGTPPDPNELGEKNSIFLEIVTPVAQPPTLPTRK